MPYFPSVIQSVFWLYAIVEINKNFVKVRLSEKGGYEYSFFNNADIDYYSSG